MSESAGEDLPDDGSDEGVGKFPGGGDLPKKRP